MASVKLENTAPHPHLARNQSHSGVRIRVHNARKYETYISMRQSHIFVHDIASVKLENTAPGALTVISLDSKFQNHKWWIENRFQSLPRSSMYPTK